MRPLREIDCNVYSGQCSQTDGGGGTRTCKRCSGWRLLGVPRPLGIISRELGAAVLLLTCAAVLYTLPDQMRDAKSTGLANATVLANPTVLFVPFVVVFHLWMRSKCKPIYDRWVAEHGPDPDKWPATSKPK